ncbi:hypothetical protein BD324DRAFT_620507 [Kockovaella imperatae]|uniref:F-box domain-containing protein n=1 Tax=Kockovaella imperatae TaxID=4999 RepID=A0A1Y1UJW2_9TREE|nr:hypothetical protein BD324DRAFT_620507 [Kockovaella imperatae]ORX38350.1 hypothetical protein BD324DRAFT_620507 [Kockovaella imperatae]
MIMSRSSNGMARNLIDLPSSVHDQIARELAPSCALSLALTHASLGPAAQSAIWSELNISLQRSFLPRQLPYEWTRPLGGNKLYKIRQHQTWNHPSKYIDALESYFVHLAAHLREDPRRAKAVRSISIDSDRLLHVRFADVLKLVAPTLKRLEFICVDVPHLTAVSPQSAFPTVRQLFESNLQIHLDRLTHLSLPLAPCWDTTIQTVLRRTPNLESLVLTPENPYSGGWGESTIFEDSNLNEPWTTLPCLRRLEITEFALPLLPLLEALIRAAPDLEWLSLQDACRRMTDVVAGIVLDYIATSLKLKYLAIPRRGLTDEQCKKLPRSVVEISTMESTRPWGIPQLEATTIPPIPSMQLFHSHARVSDQDQCLVWTWHEGTCALPAPLRPISPELLQAIGNASDLLMIELSGTSDDEWAFPTSETEWEDSLPTSKAHPLQRAVFIRTYTRNSDQTAEAEMNAEQPEEVFTHCRSYYAEHCLIENDQLLRAQCMWEEHLDYCGSAVPGDILARVYDLLGENAGWTRPGRGLELPEEAWDLLKDWKRSVD